MVGNLISKNSVLANFCAIDEVHVSQVNIWDKNGNVSWAAKWTAEEVKAIERFQGYRSFQKEYMNNPITEGAVFRNDWIKWGRLPDLKKFDELVLYIDPSFKGTTKTTTRPRSYGERQVHSFGTSRRSSASAAWPKWYAGSMICTNGVSGRA